MRTLMTRARAFTLVEMLVVILIIGALVAILVSVIGQARESGNRTVCLANLRTIGQAMMMYSQANRNCLPNDDQPGNDWYDYFSGDLAIVNLNAQYVRTPKAFYCPSDQNAIPTKIVNCEFDQPNSARTSYDYYCIYWPYEQPPLLTKMHSQAPLAWDIDGGTVSGTSTYRNHKARAGNVVFADGHGEWVLASKWDDTNRPIYFNRFYPTP